jgi:hypothetical protein
MRGPPEPVSEGELHNACLFLLGRFRGRRNRAVPPSRLRHLLPRTILQTPLLISPAVTVRGALAVALDDCRLTTPARIGYRERQRLSRHEQSGCRRSSASPPQRLVAQASSTGREEQDSNEDIGVGRSRALEIGFSLARPCRATRRASRRLVNPRGRPHVAVRQTAAAGPIPCALLRPTADVAATGALGFLPATQRATKAMPVIGRRRIVESTIWGRGRFPMRVARAFTFVFFRRRAPVGRDGFVVPAVPRVSCGSALLGGDGFHERS